MKTRVIDLWLDPVAAASKVGMLLVLSLVASQAVAQTTIGVGTGIMPKYEGSKKYTGRVYPVLNHQNGTFFIAPKAEMPAAGLQTELTDSWKVGVFGAYKWGRKASDDSHLNGTHRIDNHANLGVFTQYSIGDFKMDLTLYQALKSDYGMGLEIGGSYPIWQEGLSRVQLGGNMAFMNSDAMKNNFGVTAHEAAASGGQLSTHNPSGGLKSVTVYGAYSYSLSQSLNFNAAMGLKNLAGDARNSSITERKTSLYGAVGIGYSF